MWKIFQKIKRPDADVAVVWSKSFFRIIHKIFEGKRSAETALSGQFNLGKDNFGNGRPSPEVASLFEPSERSGSFRPIRDRELVDHMERGCARGESNFGTGTQYPHSDQSSQNQSPEISVATSAKYVTAVSPFPNLHFQK